MKWSKEIFDVAFSKFGFEIQQFDESKNLIVAWVQGKDVGVYLTIQFGMFTVQTVNDFMEKDIFYLQHFDTFWEIEYLIIKNHILSEQICESVNLAVHT